jgi:hypothetical protein
MALTSIEELVRIAPPPDALIVESSSKKELRKEPKKESKKASK